MLRKHFTGMVVFVGQDVTYTVIKILPLLPKDTIKLQGMVRYVS